MFDDIPCEGCQRTLRAEARLTPIDDEGSTLTNDDTTLWTNGFVIAGFVLGVLLMLIAIHIMVYWVYKRERWGIKQDHEYTRRNSSRYACPVEQKDIAVVDVHAMNDLELGDVADYSQEHRLKYLKVDQKEGDKGLHLSKANAILGLQFKDGVIQDKSIRKINLKCRK